MKITDITGQEITVTDLEAAIAQAKRFKGYRHEPPQPVSDSRQQAYWADLYRKLKQLQKQSMR
ncbi:MAG: hypothetical protein ACO1NW_11670 [Chitinophagaceae bacterium]